MNAHKPLIAHIIYRLDVGGMENGLVNVINGLSLEEFSHAIICLAGWTDFRERISRPDVRIYDLEKRPGKDPGYYRRLYKLLRTLKPAICHTRNFGTLDCQFVAAAAGVRCRVHGEHGWHVQDLQGRNRKTVLLRRLSRTVVHRYLTVSSHMQEWLTSDLGIPRQRTLQIYNGTDTALFHPADRTIGDTEHSQELVVGCVSRLDPVKDHETLITALRQLQRDGTVNCPLRLKIVGDGEERQRLQQRVIQGELTDVVEFVGERDDIPAQLRSFDLFVLPSLNEGISNTILEAMSSGLPVIASNVGGNPELVEDGITGALFPAGDVDRLAQLIGQYASDANLRKLHGNAGRERVLREFSLHKMVSSYGEFYREVLGSPSRMQMAVN